LQGYWDAPIFYPERDSFALSEPQALTGLLFALLRLLMNPAGAYNGVLLFALVANGVAARHLLRISGVGAAAASLGGLLAVAASFALKELGVLQLLALYGPLLAIAELCRIWHGEGGWAFVRLALFWAVTLWTCVYLALLLSPFLALGIGLTGLRRKLQLRPVAAVALALAIALSAAAPLLAVQRRALASQQRSADAIRSGSASVYAYVRLKPSSFGARINPWLRARPEQRSLFPGTALLLLAVSGLCIEWRGQRRSWLLFCAGACLLAIVLSFGTRWTMLGFKPYEWLVQRLIPGFAQLRVGVRVAVVADDDAGRQRDDVVAVVPLLALGLPGVAAGFDDA